TDPGTIGPAVDIYALGCVGYFLLTGQQVFEGKSAIDVCIQHVNTPPQPPSIHGPVPAVIEAVILRCLAKRPEDRYASATALADALGALTLEEWTEAKARAWWRERVAPDVAHAGSVSTLTITVDLGDRSSQEAIW